MIRQKFLTLEAELNAQVFERQALIRGLITAILAHEENAPIPLVVIGPGGTAKTTALKALCQSIVGQYFPWLLSPYTTPEDLFGAIRTRKMVEEDLVERNPEGKAPQADVIYLDEFFNAHESILVSMNDALAEGEWSNGAGKQQLPAKLIVASSNRVPDTLVEQPVLQATWDRFVLRYRADYLQEEENVRAMLRGAMARRQARRGSTLPLTVRISMEELEEAKAEVRAVDVSPVEDALICLWQQVRAKKLVLSDRRLGQFLAVMQVQAWLDGRVAAQVGDLAILAHCLWDRPEEAEAAAGLLSKLVADLSRSWTAQLQALLEEGEEQVHRVRMTDPKAVTFYPTLTDANGKLKGLLAALKRLLLEVATSAAGAAVTGLARKLDKEVVPAEMVQLVHQIRLHGELPPELLDGVEQLIAYNVEAVRRGQTAA